ncbi:hypothetical protein VTK73DRAFT_115 [Phialemonium thermophilum]|uniref:Uncharacterized protein n=1 Tax=Phialemonium thermophilum TaxID=223376 RepID=A0ABR3Y526_9PEZI
MICSDASHSMRCRSTPSRRTGALVCCQSYPGFHETKGGVRRGQKCQGLVWYDLWCGTPYLRRGIYQEHGSIRARCMVIMSGQVSREVLLQIELDCQCLRSSHQRGTMQKNHLKLCCICVYHRSRDQVRITMYWTNLQFLCGYRKRHPGWMKYGQYYCQRRG